MKPYEYWKLAFYIGQPICEHPKHGIYTLAGIVDNQVCCKRNLTGKPEHEECKLFDISVMKFNLKQIPESLSKRFSDSILFIRFKASEGYSIFEP